MNTHIISNAATYHDDTHSFEWDGITYISPKGLSLWIGWSKGGWGNGPSRYSIQVAAEKPQLEVIREAGRNAHRNEVDVTRTYRPLKPSDVEDANVLNSACRAVTAHFDHLSEERQKKDRRRIEDRLRKDKAFLRAVIELERRLQEDEY